MGDISLFLYPIKIEKLMIQEKKGLNFRSGIIGKKKISPCAQIGTQTNHKL